MPDSAGHRRGEAIGAEAEEEHRDREALAENPREELPAVEPLVAAGEPEHEPGIYQIIVPGYTVMFVFFLVNIMGRNFIQERELGTFRRLQLAPISAAGLLAGKTLPFLLLSIIQTALLFIGGRVMFQMDWGPMPLMLLPVIFCTSLAATGLGLIVSTMVKTDSQVSAYGNILVITLAGLSGCFIPRTLLPETMKEVSMYTPHGWALEAYDQLLAKFEPDLSIVWLSCAALVAFAIVFFLIGTWQFHRNRYSA